MSGDQRPVAKRHHTVPQFYLRGFSDDARIATVRLPGDQRFIQSIGDASVGKNFYAVDGHPDGADVIERALSEVEGVAAATIDKIASGSWPLAIDDRMALGYFIALQATRVPAQRATMDHLAAQMLRLQIGAGGKAGVRKKLESGGREVSDELVERIWEQATRPEGPPIRRSKVAHIQQMFELSEELLKYIVGRPWSLIRFERRSLITSDSPVGLIGQPDDEPWEGVGFMTAWGITFPLSRKVGLLMSSIEPLIDLAIPVEEVHRGRADTSQAGTVKMEKFFNGHTVLNASEWLFHHPDDEQYVPAELPDAQPVTIGMAGPPIEFTGEPWFRATDSA